MWTWMMIFVVIVLVSVLYSFPSGNNISSAEMLENTEGINQRLADSHRESRKLLRGSILSSPLAFSIISPSIPASLPKDPAHVKPANESANENTGDIDTTIKHEEINPRMHRRKTGVIHTVSTSSSMETISRFSKGRKTKENLANAEALTASLFELSMPHSAPQKKMMMKKKNMMMTMTMKRKRPQHGRRKLGARVSSATTSASGYSKDKHTGQKQQNLQKKPSLDFVVAGFPKCGTTTLLYAFRNHPETSIAPAERCGMRSSTLSDQQASNYIKNSLAELSPSRSSSAIDSASRTTRYGIKCPAAIQSLTALSRLEEYSSSSSDDSANLIVGLRHPVELLESFYNYRVTEMYDRNIGNQFIPSFDSIISSKRSWKGVSLNITQFDLYLRQLGKTTLSQNDLGDPRGHGNLKVRPMRSKVFLYSLEQLNDIEANRSATFRQGLQSFLQLKEPLVPFGHENLNHFVGQKSHPETIGICDSRYETLRQELLIQAEQTANWIRNEFIKSNGVTVANPEHFLSSLSNWSVDPCLSRTTTV